VLHITDNYMHLHLYTSSVHLSTFYTCIYTCPPPEAFRRAFRLHLVFSRSAIRSQKTQVDR